MFDLWNNRYLHIESNSKEFNLFSKKTFFVDVVNDKQVSNVILFAFAPALICSQDDQTGKYIVNIRMYFSRCYLIENSSKTNATLSITASTYRCINKYYFKSQPFAM